MSDDDKSLVTEIYTQEVQDDVDEEADATETPPSEDGPFFNAAEQKQILAEVFTEVLAATPETEVPVDPSSANKRTTRSAAKSEDAKRARVLEKPEEEPSSLDDSDEDEPHEVAGLPTCSSSDISAKRASSSSSSSAAPKRTRQPRKTAAQKPGFVEPTEPETYEEIYLDERCSKDTPYPIDAPSGHNTVKILLPGDGYKACIVPAKNVWNHFSMFRMAVMLEDSFNKSNLSAVETRLGGADPKCFVIKIPAIPMVVDPTAGDEEQKPPAKRVSKRAEKKFFANVAAIRLIYELIRYGENKEKAARGEPVPDFDMSLKAGLTKEMMYGIMDVLNPDKTIPEDKPADASSTPSSSSSSSSSTSAVAVSS